MFDAFFAGLGIWHLQGVEAVLYEMDYTPRGALIRGIMVLIAYLLWNVAYLVIMVQGYRQKINGMPVIGSASVLAICMIALYGPFSNQSHLFFYKENYPLLALWTLCLVMQGGVFVQCLMYGQRPNRWGPRLATHFRWAAVGLLAALLVTFWTFIVYYQDYYVNEICPIAVLIVSASFLYALRERPDLKGLSLIVAWVIAIGDLLNYSAVVLGDMTDPYPDASFGYGFIYWIYFATLVLNFTYVHLLTKRKKALRLGHQPAPVAAPA